MALAVKFRRFDDEMPWQYFTALVSHRMSHTGWFEAALIAAVLSAAVFIQALGLSWATAWLCAIVPYLTRHLLLLGQLTRLIRQQRRLVPPFPLGVWGDVYRAIAHYQQRARKGRKRQLRFVRRFRAAAYSLPDALVILDKSKRIEWANPAAAALFGVALPRDQGTHFTDRVHSLALYEYLHSNDDTRPLELVPEHNQTLMLSVHVTPFGDRRKQCLVVGRDITKVFHLNVIRRDFVANASHELRTPLTVIAGFLENLSEAAITPENHQRPLLLMRQQAERMRTIIDDLLTLSRLELNDRTQDVTTVRVAEELRAIVADAGTFDHYQHDFIMQLDHTVSLVGNERELHSAFTNLVINAVRHTPPGTVITVTWRADALGAYLCVADNGPGIAAEHLPRLSERFYRVDKARSRESGGTGLGLAIVKHILQRHGARLMIASEVGTGSSFTCHFPIAHRE